MKLSAQIKRRLFNVDDPVFFDVCRKAPTEAQIKTHFWRSLPGPLAVALALPLIVCVQPLIEPQHTLPVAFWITLLLSTIAPILVLDFYAIGFKPVPDNKAAEFLTACKKTPEGEEYRRQVLGYGRKFVMSELKMLNRWNVGKPGREASRKLYGLADQ